MAKIRKARAWVLLACWIAVTTFAMIYPFKLKSKLVEHGYDKVIHVSMFTVMGVAAQAAAPWLSVLVTGPVAVGLEMAQKKIPGRTYNTVDLLANITGIFLGLASFELSSRLLK
jgi:VanZ family protein